MSSTSRWTARGKCLDATLQWFLFTPPSLLWMGYFRHCTRLSVCPKFFLRFLFFCDRHVVSSWRFFHFLKKKRFFGPVTPFFDHFYPAEFTPDGVLSSLYSYVRTSVRTSVRPSVRNFFWDFCFFGILTLVVLDDFFIFWKKWFFGPATPFFWPFFWYIRAYSGRAASQVIYAGKVLFADFEST